MHEQLAAELGTLSASRREIVASEFAAAESPLLAEADRRAGRGGDSGTEHRATVEFVRAVFASRRDPVFAGIMAQESLRADALRAGANPSVTRLLQFRQPMTMPELMSERALVASYVGDLSATTIEAALGNPDTDVANESALTRDARIRRANSELHEQKATAKFVSMVVMWRDAFVPPSPTEQQEMRLNALRDGANQRVVDAMRFDPPASNAERSAELSLIRPYIDASTAKALADGPQRTKVSGSPLVQDAQARADRSRGA